MHNSPIYNDKVINEGFIFMGQMLNNDLKIKSSEQIKYESKGTIHFIQYYAICKSMPFYWKRILRIGGSTGNTFENSLDKILQLRYPMFDLYNEIVNRQFWLTNLTNGKRYWV